MRGLKIALPLLALGLLSTLFLLSRTIAPPDPASVRQIDLIDRAAHEGLTGPAFASVTRDGDAIVIEATTATPDRADYRVVHLDGLHAEITRPSGNRLVMTAPRARLDLPRRRIDLSGGVETLNAAGYRIRTPDLSLGLDRIAAESALGLSATGPAGDLRAQEMVIAIPDGGTPTEVLFTGGVKLLYRP